jgi:uncharacterized protein YjbJ (UPF0337 family)
MSNLVAKGNWNIAKGKVKQTLARLMHDNPQFIEGKIDELIGRIQKRKGQYQTKQRGAAENEDDGADKHQ